MSRFAVILIVIAAACAPVGAITVSQKNYNEYEELNTKENLGVTFVGGRPPAFIDQQKRLLESLGQQPAEESNALILRVADEYLKRVEALGEVKFRQSVLQALQVSIVRLLASCKDEREAVPRLEAFNKSSVIKDYARAEALASLAPRRLASIKAEGDPDGTRRGGALQEMFVGKMSLVELVHSPERLKHLVAVSKDLQPDALGVHYALSSSADTDARRYAADYVFVIRMCDKVVRQRLATEEGERNTLVTVADRWVKKFRPVIAKEKYTVDYVGQALVSLSGCRGNEELARFLSANGVRVSVPKDVPPPTKPPEIPPPVK